MTRNTLKVLMIAIIALPALAVSSLSSYEAQAVALPDDDVAAVYKAKCAMCHSPKAEKAYDPEMAIETQVEIIMKGKKGEKPPYMPGFEAKGMTTEQAKALAEYMKQLRTPPAN